MMVLRKKDDSIDKDIDRNDQGQSSDEAAIEATEKMEEEIKGMSPKEDDAEILESLGDSSGIGSEREDPDSPVNLESDSLPSEKINSESESVDACVSEAVVCNVEKTNDLENSTEGFKLDDKKSELSESVSVTDAQQPAESKLSSISDEEKSKIPDLSKSSATPSEVLNNLHLEESEKNKSTRKERNLLIPPQKPHHHHLISNYRIVEPPQLKDHILQS
ncbi:unnamed protein product [Ambrosiozyma monospora]|uniref:Unnamed protein product n=1 Tax=Ambrosiozyma monospora TaxID=43982 RepID=A0A9W6WB80_AMBMO|nr:unnamed protein product [Ambrosiozyma monospora]